MGGRSKAVRDAARKAGLPGPMRIPCWKGHTHVWPSEGPITEDDVGRCQVHCQFCSLKGEMEESKWAWHLRRHIYQVHRKEMPKLIVPEDWKGKKEDSKGKVGPIKGSGKKKAAKKSAKTPTTPKKKAAKQTVTLITPPMSDHTSFGAAPMMPATPISPVMEAQMFELPPLDFGGGLRTVDPANLTMNNLLENALASPANLDGIDWDSFCGLGNDVDGLEEPSCGDAAAAAAFSLDDWLLF